MRNSAIEYQKDLVRYHYDYLERLYRFKNGAVYPSAWVKPFKKDLREVKHKHISLEDMAMDWTIPVVVIKYFLKYGI